MPIKVTTAKNEFNWIYPSSEWSSVPIRLRKKDFKIARELFLMDAKKVK